MCLSMASIEAGSSSYDVFLSFNGDTRLSFNDHLYTALDGARVRTFRDNKIPRGEEISSQLLESIHGSDISVVVFSKGYATSTWCLDELANIMECRDTKGQVVLPVFYDIDPSDVRKQKGSFAEAFQTHEECFKEDMEKVNRWRKALREASNLTGWDLNSRANQHEAVFIEDIVQDVLAKLGHKYSLDVPKHLVGISSHVENIISVLRTVTDDHTSFVNIHGMGGIGKTTLAKAVFNKLYREFEGSCFISNVNEHSKDKAKGLAELRKRILCDTLKSKLYSYPHDDSLVDIVMKANLGNKRVLVVLDDVVYKKHVSLLVGEGQFGPGSVLMVTSRDERLLTEFPVHLKYEAKGLPHDESLKFFSLHAFGTTHPPEEYADISNDIVKYADGLPLALEVLGSSLYQRNKIVWQSAFEKLRKFPDHQIQEKLMISFDSLDEDIVKNIFLDIACFFGGRNKEYVSTILSARWGLDPESSLMILVDRSLLKVTFENELRMHDLVRDMGREIVRQQDPRRTWLHKEAWEVLEMKRGTDKVEGLALDVQTDLAEADRTLRTESFKNMKCLNLLQINGVHLSGCYSHLPRDIKWLCWHKSLLKSLPSTFRLHNLVVLDMQYSTIEKLESLDKLKILNLSHSEFAKTPNLVGLLSLERLILEHCKRLAEVDDQSVRHLEKLVHLSLKECERLNNLPESICNLKSLETLDISGCWMVEKLPENLGAMESLTELLANETAIMKLPSSVGQLKRIRKISLRGCKPSVSNFFINVFSLMSSSLETSLNSSSQLTGLDLSYRGLSDGEIFIDLGSLSTLQELNLSGNNFINLPSGIGRLPMLKYLLVKDCTNLLSVSELPSSLKEMDAVNCSALERLKIQSNKIPSLYVSGCKKLIEIEGMEGMGKSWVVVSEDRGNLSNNLKQSLVQALCKGDEYDIIIAHDGEMPEWFSHQGEGSSLSFHVPPGSDRTQIQGLVVWVVCTAAIGGNICSYLRGEAVIKNKSTGVELFRRSIMLYTVSTNSSNQCSWVSHISLAALRAGEELELSVEVKHTYFQVKKCGVHFIIYTR